MVFPREPLVKVIAPIMEAQLIETALLTIINHQSLIATKAARWYTRPKETPSWSSACAGPRDRTPAFTEPGRLSSEDAWEPPTCSPASCSPVPVMGTHAHSWIMSFPDEYTAFKTYARLYPDACTLLVDTYDTLRSGVPNAIRGL